ncbi:hypothetical protein NBRC10512_003677 [Rhodotorula toruloides]|uniref:RHTO0S13e02784g1_1 n=2 Tax=Rhodotorula toruloides TaxID=5286 RepID=A0A061BAB3_RHOTO|nr:DUF659 and Ribonuclease H-like domain containing protein [Rhodotorula toruloides NP11]EMS22467.1 DUF659 and Ribonuclease H-like domain containing protein [Rhodotorula toruloides NP11]CDR46874.1 RHTO0S13e02784g1_1 [Rhodotorula toruloides]
MSGKRQGKTRNPAWNHFIKLEEDLSAGGILVEAKYNTIHYKAWCKPEFERRLRALEVQEGVAGTRGASSLLSSEDARRRKATVLADMSWIPGRPKENLAPHVAECKETQSLSSVKPSKADLPDRRITLHFVRRRFTDAEYQEFKRDVLEVVVGTNTPFSWVDHPLVRRWVAKWIGAKLPTRNTLTGTLLRRAVDELNVAVGKNVRGKMATLTFDGWNNIKRQHLVAFVLTVDGVSYTVAVEDTSSEKKGGAEAYALLVKHLEAVQAKYGVVVVGVCTDSGSDCAWARGQLLKTMPTIIVVPCYAHQINLVVGDLFKKRNGETSMFKTVADEIIKVVSWFCEHSRAYAMLRNAQKKKGFPRILALVYPVATRWSSQHACAARLLEVMKPMRTLLIDDRERLLAAGGTGKDAQDKAEGVLKLVADDAFWKRVEGLVSILQPLAVAANIAQATSCRLDQVFLLFGRLFLQYRQVQQREEASEDTSLLVSEGATRIISSLESRWIKADQEVFLVAALLNPFFGRTRLPFSAVAHQWAGDTLLSILKRLSTTPGRSTDARGAFADHLLEIEELRQQAERKNASPNPVDVWLVYVGTHGETSIARLALRVLAVVPNTAANERVFSAWSLIHTKTRNRLGHDLVMDAARLRAHLLDNLPQRSRQKRETAPNGAPSPSPLLSTRAAAAVSSSIAEIDVDDLLDLDATIENVARSWFRRELEAEEQQFEEEDALLGSAKLTLEDIFKDDKRLEEVRATVRARWAEGEAAMEAEAAQFESVSAEGGPSEVVELGKRQHEEIVLSDDDDEEEAWETIG